MSWERVKNIENGGKNIPGTGGKCPAKGGKISGMVGKIREKGLKILMSPHSW